MSDHVNALGEKVVELFGQCAAAPDDLDVARAADEALWELEEALAPVLGRDAS
jgi:hypothetical protein